jgi:hypothetical protein
MKVIQLNMKMIPKQIKTLLEIVVQSPNKLFRKLTAIPLTNIKDMGQKCVELSQNTEKGFVNVIDLLSEVLETTQAKKGTSERQQGETEATLTGTHIKNNRTQESLEKKARKLAEFNEKVSLFEKNICHRPEFPPPPRLLNSIRFNSIHM